MHAALPSTLTAFNSPNTLPVEKETVWQRCPQVGDRKKQSGEGFEPWPVGTHPGLAAASTIVTTSEQDPGTRRTSSGHLASRRVVGLALSHLHV
jgi:hypothetical protein